MIRAGVVCALVLLLTALKANAGTEAHAGEWRGGYFCYPSNFTFSLSVGEGGTADDPVLSTLTYEVIDRTGKTKAESRSVDYLGYYDPASRTLRLEVKGKRDWKDAHLRPITALVDGGSLVGRFDTDPAKCTFLVADRQGGLAAPDDTLLKQTPAERRNFNAAVDAYLAEADSKAMCAGFIEWARRAGDEHGEPALKGQMNRIIELTQPLVGDAEFTAFAGKPYDALTPPERDGINKIFIRRCRGGFREAGVASGEAVMRLFMESGQGGRKQALSYLHGMRQLRAWRDRSLETAAATTASATAYPILKSIERAGDRHLAALWPSERTAFLDAIDQRIGEIAADSAMAMATDAVDGSSGHDGLLALLAWDGDNAELLQRLAPERRDEARAVVSRAVDGLLDQLAEAELAAMPIGGTDMASLEEGTAWYMGFRERYAGAIGSEQVVAVLGEFRTRRDANLAAVGPEVIAAAEAATTVAEVNELVGKVLGVSGDRIGEPGSVIWSAAEQRVQSLEVERFMARFSPRERELMTEPGRLAVPAVYDAPTAEEVRRAILREIASMGGSMIDDRTASLAVPPFGPLGFSIHTSLSDATVLACEKRDRGFECAYQLPMTNALPDEVRRFFAGHALYRSIFELAMAALDQHKEFAMTDTFVLTERGWRSPTAAARRLEGIIAHYDTVAEAARRVGDAQCNSLAGHMGAGQLLCGN